MMEFVFIGLIILALALYGFGRTTDYVSCVEAGDTSSVNACDLRIGFHKEKHRLILDEQGRIIKRKDFLKVLVKGNCLKPKGISDNDELLVKKFTNEAEFQNLKSGDILMIHLKDKNIDKIRVFEKKLDDGSLQTYRFDENGNKKYSSRPHEVMSVIGKVMYQL